MVPVCRCFCIKDILNSCDCFQLAVVRQVLRREIGLKIVEVESDKATVEGGDVLWTGKFFFAVNT